uniref:Hypothetical medulloblastoma antigen MU-MB-50.63 n=1 Tax=Homo sapiens TaxID=9606 RepID=Q7Z5D3_HUMAN|nr:hypothetical medulloblastoma antigen MU-MB-50.63 [Homo sapiens]
MVSMHSLQSTVFLCSTK